MRRNLSKQRSQEDSFLEAIGQYGEDKMDFALALEMLEQDDSLLDLLDSMGGDHHIEFANFLLNHNFELGNKLSITWNGDDLSGEEISEESQEDDSGEHDISDESEVDDLLANLNLSDEELKYILHNALVDDNIEMLNSMLTYERRHGVKIDFSGPINCKGRLTNPISLCKKDGKAYEFLRTRQKERDLESTTGSSSSLSSIGGGYRDLMQPYLNTAKTSITSPLHEHKGQDTIHQHDDEDRELIKKFNTPAKSEDKVQSLPKLTPETDKFLIPHFRGINFNRGFFTKEKRREFGKKSHVGEPIHSLTSFKNAGLRDKLTDDIGEEEERRLSELDTKINRLFNTKLNESGKFQQLKNGKIVRNGKVFERARDRMQQRYTNLKNNKIDAVWEGVADLVKDTEFEDLALEDNPYVSTGKTPEHAIRYALGLSFFHGNKGKRADPRYRRWNAQAKYRLIGMLYITLHTIDEYNKANPGDVTRLNKEDRIGAHVNYLNETEVSFIGGIKGRNVAITMPILYPSFNKEWIDYYQEMYGLNESQYDDYKRRLMATKRHAPEHKTVKNEIREHLKEHYSAIAISLVKSKAAELDKKLVYIDPLGEMKPYEEWKLTGKSSSLAGEIRKLATKKSADHQNTRSWQSFERDESNPDMVSRKLDFSPAKQQNSTQKPAEKTAEELVQDQVSRVSNPKQYYADDEVNALMESHLAPDVRYITPAISTIQDSLSDAIRYFNDIDILNEEESNQFGLGIRRGHADFLKGNFPDKKPTAYSADLEDEFSKKLSLEDSREKSPSPSPKTREAKKQQQHDPDQSVKK